MKIEPNDLLDRAGYTAMPSDRLVMAAEAACQAVAQPGDYQEPWMAAAAAADTLPAHSTEFERGLAAGIAFGLIASPAQSA